MVLIAGALGGALLSGAASVGAVGAPPWSRSTALVPLSVAGGLQPVVTAASGNGKMTVVNAGGTRQFLVRTPGVVERFSGTDTASPGEVALDGTGRTIAYTERSGRSVVLRDGRVVSARGGACPDLSADGRTLVYLSAARLVPEDRDRGWDVNVTDVGSGRTRLLSGARGGMSGDGLMRCPQVSGDGRRVVFATTAQLMSADRNDRLDVYAVDVSSGRLRLVTTAALWWLSAAYDAVVSGDGRWVVFYALAVSGGEQLWSVDLDRGRGRRLAEGCASSTGFDVDPLGRGEVAIDWRGSTVLALCDDGRLSSGPAWGRVVPAAGFRPVPGQYGLGTVFVSGDGRTANVSVTAEDENHTVWRVTK